MFHHGRKGGGWRQKTEITRMITPGAVTASIGKRERENGEKRELPEWRKNARWAAY